MARFNTRRFNIVRWNAGVSSPTPPLPPSTSSIILAMMKQLSDHGSFSQYVVGLSLIKEPSLNVIGNHYVTLTPGRENALDQATGMGRWGSGMSATIYVNIYNRLALDVAYQDEQYLLNSRGLRPLVHAAIDALQQFIPIDENGSPLVQEPIRILGNERTFKWQKSDDWGFISIPVGVQYSRACDTSVFI